MKKITAILLMSLGLVFSQASLASLSPQALVEQTSQLMLTKLKEEEQVLKDQPGRLYDLVNEIVLPHFDFEYMSQMVLAKYWRRASADERSAFTNEFRTLLVRTYATSLKEYTDQELIFLPFRPEKKEGLATVRSEVEQPGGFPIPIDYRLRSQGEDWKVFDVVIDGVSLVTNYRTTFAKEIRSDGIDGLIKTLADKNKQALSE